MRTRNAWVLLGALLAAAPAAAQESIFALQGLGISEETGDARARSLGVLGVALDDPQTAITLNPASLGSLSRMTLSVMGLAGRRTSRDEAGEDRRGMARFPHERVALPVFGRVVLSTGLVVRRNFKGDFQLARRLEDNAYVQRFERRGAIYAVPVGLSRSFGPRFRAGASVDFLLGTVDESWVTGEDSLGGFLSLRTRRRDGFTGRTATLGAVGAPLPWLRLGLAVEPRHELNREARTTLEDARLGGGTGALRDSTARSDVQFPATVRAGAALQLGSRWLVAADFMRRDWSDYDGRAYGAETLGLESRVGGGLEWRPRGASVLGRFAYRAGASRYTWPQRVGGDPVHETTLHLGLGLDFKDGFGRLDAGFEYAAVGSVDRNGLEERTWRFVLGVSGQEIWRRKSPRR